MPPARHQVLSQGVKQDSRVQPWEVLPGHSSFRLPRNLL